MGLFHKPKEQLIILRRPFKYDELLNKYVEFDNSDIILQYSVGDTFVAGAPGMGRVVYEITRIDKDGIWGILIEDYVED